MLFSKGLKLLNREDYKPLYVQISDNIVNYIQNEELKPGDPLPSQNELIKHYGVSQITVRLAMQRLATEGVIHQVQGRGTFVAEPKVTERISGVQSLESSFAMQGMEITTECLDLSQVMPANRILEDLNLPAGSETLRIKRLKRLDGCVLGLETRHFPLTISDLFSPSDLRRQPFVDLLASRQDTEVKRISYFTKSAVVLDGEAEMMGIDLESAVLIHYGVYYAREDKPVMAGKITYPAEKIEVQYDVFRSGSYHLKVLK